MLWVHAEYALTVVEGAGLCESALSKNCGLALEEFPALSVKTMTVGTKTSNILLLQIQSCFK